MLQSSGINKLDELFKYIIDADIAVIPSNNSDWYMAKADNKLTTFMGLGMPVIAYPLPAYKKIMNYKRNSLCAETIEQWREVFLYLQNRDVRQKLGVRARKDVIRKFSIKTIGKQWEKILEQISQSDNNKIIHQVTFKMKIKYFIFQIYCFLFEIVRKIMFSIDEYTDKNN